RDEIVEEVVENLRPWKNHKSRDSVTAVVNQQLNLLVELAPLQSELFDARQYRGHAKKLDKALSNVEKLLKAAPAMLAVSFFNSLPPLELTDDDEYPLVQPMPHKSIEEIERAHRVRANGFLTELRRLRKICAVKLGTHPNYDRSKHLSARWAYGLMEELSDGQITGTADKPLRNIASLLYAVVSGHQNADLKRACDDILREKART